MFGESFLSIFYLYRDSDNSGLEPVWLREMDTH